MHPRNIYKNPPDFKELAIKYPNFCSYVKIDLSGKAKLDFQNAAALAELTKTLLLKDFNLSVDIPADKLIPTLPLRLNYILWIEDLLTVLNIPNKHEIYGVDVGTGASCIYPLLGAKKGWKMLATEIDPTSIMTAIRNVETNGLSQLIEIKENTNRETILMNMLDEKTVYHFTMCNPPFFTKSEIPQNRTKMRKPANNARTGLKNELETDGGEVAFVLKMIEESIGLKNNVKIFTTMIGKQSSLKVLQSRIKEVGAMSHSTTEFRQGKTTRWGLAWSFLNKLPETAKKVKEKPLVFELSESSKFDSSVQLLKTLLKGLGLTVEIVKSDAENFTANVKAFENTWSNQRRKRREAERNESPLKKPKLEVSSSASILEFVIKLYEIDNVVSLEAKWSSGALGKDGVHQIVQYLKNNWKIQN